MKNYRIGIILIAVNTIFGCGASISHRGDYSPLREFLISRDMSAAGVARHAYLLCREHPESSERSLAALTALLETQSDLEQLEIGAAPNLAVTYIPVKTEAPSRGGTPLALYSLVIADLYDLERSVSLLSRMPDQAVEGLGPFIVVSWQQPLQSEGALRPAVINLSHVPTERMNTWMQYYKKIVSRPGVWKEPPGKLLMTLRDQVQQLAVGFRLALDATGLAAKVLF